MQEAIDRSLGVLGIRIYGGHFFVAGGRLDFISCVFMDFEILTPMTSVLFLLRSFAALVWLFCCLSHSSDVLSIFCLLTSTGSTKYPC